MQAEHRRLWALEAHLGRRLPRVQHEPELLVDVADLWEAFWHLQARRSATWMGAGAIPYSEILAYCRLHHIPHRLWDRLLWGLQILEDEWRIKTHEREIATSRWEQEHADP